ncbi:hypothetical protein, partial [Gluconacetobacter liquefaciens]|uniref:hypothetical protein n=1 Tax=Gluconacetobacter liquefaciens TaxID=89584 RepID=UPI001C8019B6
SLNPAGPRKLAGPNRQVKNLSPGGEERSTPHPNHRQHGRSEKNKKVVPPDYIPRKTANPDLLRS